MPSSSTGLCGDDVQLPHSITLTVFSCDFDTPYLLLGDSSESTIDYNVKAVADILRTPQYLTCVNLHPIQRCVNLQDCSKFEDQEGEHTRVPARNLPRGDNSDIRRLASVRSTIGRFSSRRSNA